MSDLLVYVVDDDRSARDSLLYLLSSAGITARGCASAAEFLEHPEREHAGCLVLDVRMQGMSGIELFELLRGRGDWTPTIFLTGFSEIHTCVRALHLGALDFIEKPVKEDPLVFKVQKALAQSANTRRLLGKFALLSDREREVGELIVEGHRMKQIAALLNVSIQTVAKHRTRVLEKLGVESDVELVHLMRELPRKPKPAGKPDATSSAGTAR